MTSTIHTQSSRPVSPVFASFALPGAEDVFDLVALQHARAVAETFLDRFEGELEASSEQLVPLLRAWLGQDPTAEQVRHPSVGLLRRALDPTDSTSPVVAAAALLLHLQSTGTHGSWRASFAAPVDLLWERWRLPTASALAVRATAGRASVRLAGPGATRGVELSRAAGRWDTEDATSLSAFTLAGRSVAIVTPVGAESARLLGGRDQPPVPVAVRDLGAAAELLEVASPEYAAWAGRPLWGVVPALTPADTLISASIRACPWMVMTCCPAGPEQLAELLVHESTHQYLYLLSQFGPLDDGSDEELYYSPLKETGRPIGAILLAYHACANMLLMHDHLRAAGHASTSSAARRTTLIDQVRVLESALRRSRAITEIGDALWEPLAARLDAAELR